MIRNFVKIALRSMMRNKAYTFINIAGLSVGVACCLILALYIQDELTYDKHHRDGKNVYRVTTQLNIEKGGHIMATTSVPIAWGIKDEIPEFETVTRLVNPPGVSQNLIRYGANQFYESNGLMADSTLFEVLTYDFIEGNPKTALREANSVVITEKLAKKIFGNESALNKIITINQGGPVGDYNVTGVFRDQTHSHLQANFFISIASTGGWGEFLRRNDVANEWAGQNFMYSYVKLKPGHDADAVISKMNTVFQKHGADDLKAAGMTKLLGLEPLERIYLFSAYGEQSPRVTYLYVIGTIAVFILLIACINFMNLSTAKASKRANEVGLRKTLGAYRSSLISQFLGEALIIVIIAILLSIVIVQLGLPLFNQVTSKTIDLQSANFIFLGGSLIGITIVTGLVAGSYPAFYLSSFQPAQVLKGKSVLQSSNSLMRKSLVVFQFVIAITLVCGMIVIGKQLRYIQDKNLGFETSHRIVLPLRTNTAQNNFATLRDQLDGLASVRAVTATNYIPGATIWTDFHLYKQGGDVVNSVHFRNNWVEPNYLDVLGIKIIAGKNFSGNRATDAQRNVIINREGVKQLGFTLENVIGQPLFAEWQGQVFQFNIIGVMEDYHQVTLKEAIYPLLFRIQETPIYDFAIVDTESQDLHATVQEFEKVWKTTNADTPFEYTFLDDNIQMQYDEDRRVSEVISTFTIIAMIISCLGLYGLSTYMAERRFKEIGVRKVMGATVQQIVSMMSGEFMKLVLIAFLIAVPLSWYAINKWLEGFAYKTTLDVFVFMLAGLAALGVALLTVSFESIRAASGNPVNALRNE